ncbi:MAG: MHYT domain-containing protein, partial [Candidatus Sulfotelmatobacter sp.]
CPSGRGLEMNSIAVINGSYDYRLVGLSITLAMVASYAALDLAGRVTSTRGRGGLYGLVLGAMGLGIWAMHDVGMLALTMPMTVFYHISTVALSRLAAISASGVALFVVSPEENECLAGNRRQRDYGDWHRSRALYRHGPPCAARPSSPMTPELSFCRSCWPLQFPS